MNEPAMAARFALSGTVLHDTIDDEVIVIDLTTGTYYSLRGTAAEVWGLLQRSPGMTHEELAQAVVVRYQTNGHDVEAAMTQFLGQLHAEGLVSEVPASPATPAVAAMVEPSTTPAPEFVAPVLEKYTDMQDLVLIDPVHDVSEAGWPHTAPTDAAAGRSGT